MAGKRTDAKRKRGGRKLETRKQKLSWMVFVGESHAALYGERQPRLGGLEDDRILIASVVEPLCYFLVSCSGGDNARFVLPQGNPGIEGSAAQGFTARGI